MTRAGAGGTPAGAGGTPAGAGGIRLVRAGTPAGAAAHTAIERGLAPIAAPDKALVLSSATPGQVADDSSGEHSVLVAELLNHLNQPGARTAKLEINPLGAIAGPDSHAIAGFESQSEQRRGGAVNFVG